MTDLDIVRDNYINPKNFGTPKWKATNIGHIRNMSCGDDIKIYLEIDNEKVTNVNFEGEGCSICIATASLLTEFIKKKLIEEVKKIDYHDLLKLLKIEIRESRHACVEISLSALRESIKDL